MAKRHVSLAVRMVAYSGNVVRALGRVIKSTKSARRQAWLAQQRYQRFQNALLKIGVAVAGVWALSRAFGALARQISGLQDIQNRLRVVIDTNKELADTQEKLYHMAQRTRGAWADTQRMYARLAIATGDFNIEQERLLNVTETIAKSLIVSGASAAEVKSVMTQLPQALAADRLGGEEFRAIMENAPVLMRQMSKAMGGTIGDMRRWRDEGVLTTKNIFGAIERSQKSIDDMFARTSATIAQSQQRIKNASERFLQELNRLANADQAGRSILDRMVEGIDLLTESLKDIVYWARIFAAEWKIAFDEDLLGFAMSLDILGQEGLNAMQEKTRKMIEVRQATMQALERQSGIPGASPLDEGVLQGLVDEIEDLENKMLILRSRMAVIRPPSNEQANLIRDPEVESVDGQGDGVSADEQKHRDRLKRLQVENQFIRDGAFYYVQQMEALNEIVDSNKALQEIGDREAAERVAAMERYIDKYDEMMREARDRNEEVRQSYKDLGRTISEEFFSTLTAGEGILDAFGRAVLRLADRLMQLYVIDPIGDRLGQFLFQGLGNAFGAGFLGTANTAGLNTQAHALYNPVGNAMGGRITSAGLSLVGESGPEVVALPRGAQVFRNGVASQGFGGGDVVINVNGVQDPTLVENQLIGIKEHIKREVQESIVSQVKRPGVTRSLLGA